MENSFTRDIKKEIVEVDDYLDLRDGSNETEAKEEEEDDIKQIYSNNSANKSTSIQNYPIKMKSQRKFQASWLKDPLFKGWLRRHPTNNTLAQCKVCAKTELKANRRSTFLRHYISKKHQLNWAKNEQNAKKNFARESNKKKSVYQTLIIKF
jgi:hypothetical protein